VAPLLFRRYPDPSALAVADRSQVETIIHPTGFFRNKSKNIILCAQALLDHYGGEVPRTMEELVTLPGVARKTANVVLGNAFGIPGIPVDTHVGRLSLRLGLTLHDNPVKAERDLNSLVPAKEWTLFGLRLILHGRKICRSQRPLCSQCTLAGMCPKVGVVNSQ
jgi:endonuclease-3